MYIPKEEIDDIKVRLQQVATGKIIAEAKDEFRYDHNQQLEKISDALSTINNMLKRRYKDAVISEEDLDNAKQVFAKLKSVIAIWGG